MAGVIGTKRFSYDVWGDPVNLAARLENTCEADCIHVSAEVCRHFGDAFALRSRGLTEIKGVGRQETFFLIGPRATEPLREAAA